MFPSTKKKDFRALFTESLLDPHFCHLDSVINANDRRHQSWWSVVLALMTGFTNTCSFLRDKITTNRMMGCENPHNVVPTWLCRRRRNRFTCLSMSKKDRDEFKTQNFSKLTICNLCAKLSGFIEEI